MREVDDPTGRPDLILVEGIASNGDTVEGYVRASDLYSDTSVIAGDPQHPDGRDIPVYESDGTTRVGVFHTDG